MWFFAVAVVYFVVVLTIGMRRSRTRTDFATAAGSFGWFRLGLSLLATIVGGGMFMGTAELGYSAPQSVLALGLAYLVGNLLVALLVPRMRALLERFRADNLIGLLGAMYPRSDGIGMATLSAFATLFVFVLMLASQYVAINTFLVHEMSRGGDGWLAAGVAVYAGFSVLVYCITGGLSRDVTLDGFQMLVILCGVGALALGVDAAAVKRVLTLPQSTYALDASVAVFLVGTLVFVIPTFFARYDLWQRVLAARSEGHASGAFVFAGIGAILFFVFFGFVGLMARADNVGSGSLAGVRMIDALDPPGVRLIAVLSFAAAVMSSADTFLGVAALALYSLWRRLSGADSERLGGEDSVPVQLRWCALVAGVVGVGLAYFVQNIVDLFASAFGVLVVFVPAILGGASGKRSARRATRSAGIGLLAVIAASVVYPRESFLFGIVLSTAIYFFPERERAGAARSSD